MSASLRFLALAVVGWAGLRAASLGMIPGSEAFTLSRGKAAETRVAAATPIPPIVQTEFPAIEPPPALQAAAGQQPLMMIPAGTVPMPRMVPFYYYPAAAPAVAPASRPAALPLPPRRSPLTRVEPEPEPVFYSPIPQLDEWPLSRMASAALPARRSAAAPSQQSAPGDAVKARLDRLQLTTWALLRGSQGVIVGPRSLAAGGTLGGSQAGARLTYNFFPALAASLRTTSSMGQRGGELAAGVRLTPFRTIPLAITAERRQRIGRYGGRSALAVFVEGGVYGRPMPWRFQLDGYAQAGMVGARSRDWFVDGGATMTRPLFRRFSAGLGVWGGAQPGLYRVDAGPRVSMKVRDNVRVHLDWRQRITGNAQPGSGPALTLAADF